MKELHGFEEFRDTARRILNESVAAWAVLRATSFAELSKANERLQRERQLLFASEAAHINDHYARWDASHVLVNAKRQMILNELAEDREAVRSAVDLVKTLADVAVVAAQQAEAES